MFLTIRRSDNSKPATLFEQAQTATHLHLSNNKVQVQLAKRLSFPMTYCQKLDDGSFQLGYGNTSPSQNEEFLKITIQKDGTIDIERDARATLPVFYGYSEGIFILSNDYGTVVEALPKLTLNSDDIVLTIAPRRFHRPTLWHEVGMLRSGEALHVGVSRTPVKTMPRGRTWIGTNDLPESDPEEFLPRLDDTLARHLRAYVPSPEEHPPGFEVSGGLDSSTILLYFAQTHPGAAWHGMSISYPDLQRVTQANKLHAISSYAPNGTLSLIKMEQMYDEASARFTTADPRPFSVIDSTGTASFETIASTLEKAGVTTIFKGNGGDNLFDHNLTASWQLDIGEEPMRRVLAQLPNDFLTDHFRDHLRALNEGKGDEEYKLPTLSTSACGSDPIVNSYIHHGIWPANPFLDTDFFTYCQGLPYKFKHNKHISRIYYRAKNWPSVLYDETYPNEVPEDDLEKPYLTDEFAQIIEDFANRSVLDYLGYIDAVKMLQAYHDIKNGERAIDPGIFTISLWLNIEFNLHLAMRAGQWQPN